MPAKLVLEHLTSQPTSLMLANAQGASTAATRFRSDDGDASDSSGLILLPSPLSLQLRDKVTASTSQQTVTLISSAGLSDGDYLIVDPGQANQEVVQAITASPFTAIFRNNHVVGASLLRVSSSHSKIFRLNVTAVPNSAIAAFTFRRSLRLADGVYDQWRTTSSYSPSDGLPWISSASNAYTKTPTVPTLIRASSVSVLGPVTPYVEVQWLFTGEARLVVSSAYDFAWQES